MNQFQKALGRLRRSISTNLWSLFIFLLCFGLVLSLIWPDFSFSQTENRKLASFPSFTWQGLWKGSSQEDFESYMQDQFPGRDLFFHLNYIVRKAAGQSEINGVYLGHGALFSDNRDLSPEILTQNRQALADLASEKSLPVSLILCPQAASVQKERLPYQAVFTDEMLALKQMEGTNDGVTTAALDSLLEEQKNNYIFYKTDHHWTSDLAGMAAGAWMNQVHPEYGFSLDDFEKMPVSHSFMGTLSWASGSCFLKDTIDIRPWKKQTDMPYTVKWADGTVGTSIYQSSALSKKDQYQVFLGPNQSIVQIDTMADNYRNLLILKDSYANSMIQFLLPYYRSITIVDPRYCMDDLSKIIIRYGINEVLAVYSCRTFMSDSSLSVMCQDLIPEEDAAASDDAAAADDQVPDSQTQTEDGSSESENPPQDDSAQAAEDGSSEEASGTEGDQ